MGLVHDISVLVVLIIELHPRTRRCSLVLQREATRAKQRFHLFEGEILRQKSIKRNGNIRYCNKLACQRCKCKCTSSKFKEADFNKDTLIKAIDARKKQELKDEKKDNPNQPRTSVVKKAVQYVLHLDQNKMDNRKCLSEHPFGTMKRTLGQYYFLLKGFAKVGAEMGLFCLSYNLRRAISLRGVPTLVAALR